MSQFRRCVTICVCTVATLSISAAAEGERLTVSSADSMLLTVSADHFNSGELGSNASLDWIHHSASRSGERRTHTLGFAVYSATGNRWGFGKVGTAYAVNDRITLQAQVNAGGGKAADSAFGYQVYDGSVTAKADPRLYFRLGQQFYRIDDSHSFLLKPGLVLVPTHRVQVDVSYARSASGNIRSQFVSGRMDFATQSVDLLGGFSLGHSTPEILNLEIGSTVRVQKFQNIFMGVSFRLPQSTLTVMTDFLYTKPGHRDRLTLGWRFPIGILRGRNHGD